MGQENSKLKRRSANSSLDSTAIAKSHRPVEDGQPRSSVASDDRSHLKQRGSYFLGHDDTEIDRLHQLNFLMKEVFGGNVLSSTEHCIQNGARFLDVGCGPGTWILDFATEHPEVEFTGVDIAGMFPADIKPSNVTFVQTNVLDGLRYPDGIFDFVNMKMMHSAWASGEWPEVIAEIFRVLKPGGYIQLMEVDGIYSTTDSDVKAFVEKVQLFLSARGRDISVARKLGDFEEAVGFEIVQREERVIPVGWGGAIGMLMLDDIRQIMILNKQMFMIVFGMNELDYVTYINDIMQRCGASKTQTIAYAVVGQKPGG